MNNFINVYSGPSKLDDLALILQRARDAGVQKIYITGTNLEDSKEAIEAIESNTDGNVTNLSLSLSLATYVVLISPRVLIFYCWLPPNSLF
jgi:Tat protein secretion system quality control protein TatD with DNase activity